MQCGWQPRTASPDKVITDIASLPIKNWGLNCLLRVLISFIIITLLIMFTTQ